MKVNFKKTFLSKNIWNNTASGVEIHYPHFLLYFMWKIPWGGKQWLHDSYKEKYEANSRGMDHRN